MIRGAEVVVEVLDARDISGTRLPIAEKFAGSKRLLMVANKIDLLPPGASPPIMQNKGITISAKEASESHRAKLIKAIMERTEKRPVHALFIGYPNVGKSSLINLLARRQAAKVSPVAGTTKNIQWVKINDELVVSDYRGLYPNQEPERELVRKSAIKIGSEQEKYAYEFAEKALRSPAIKIWLEKKYDIDLTEAKNSEDVLTIIAKRRGWYLKGGEPNIGEAARNLMREMMNAPELV
jgi:ribosome biogenesis GTPase A